MKDETKGLYGHHEHLAGVIASRIVEDCRRKAFFICSGCERVEAAADFDESGVCNRCAAVAKEGRAA